MDTINDGVRFLNRSIDACTDYVKENAIQLFIIGALLYYLKNRKPQAPGYTLSQWRPAVGATTNTAASASDNTSATPAATAHTPRSSPDAHLLAVRERQQQLANQRALEAAKLRKEKQELERERKNNVAKNKKIDETKGDVLGGGGGSSSGASCAYNPLQPWSGHSNGFRPARRTARRG